MELRRKWPDWGAPKLAKLLAVQAVAVCALLVGIVVLDRSPLIVELQRADTGGGGDPLGADTQPARRARSSSAKSGNRDATVSSGNSS